MRSILGTASALVVVLALTGSAPAQTPACDDLSGEQKALAGELLESQYPYDCCDETIAECLKKKPVCALAYRLAENICRRVAEGQKKEKITRGLSRRARSMMPSGKKAGISIEGTPVRGEPGAPVVLVTYSCARCPFCSKIIPPLYKAVAEGLLAGKVRLYFKTFPIRSHEYSKETGLGFVAAARMGKFWEFMLYSYERFDEFCIKKQRSWADAVGLDGETFEQLVADPETRSILIQSKKEGLRNKVDATPAFFINGRRFAGDLDMPELIDVLEEEYERVNGREYRK